MRWHRLDSTLLLDNELPLGHQLDWVALHHPNNSSPPYSPHWGRQDPHLGSICQQDTQQLQHCRQDNGFPPDIAILNSRWLQQGTSTQQDKESQQWSAPQRHSRLQLGTKYRPRRLERRCNCLEDMVLG